MSDVSAYDPSSWSGDGIEAHDVELAKVGARHILEGAVAAHGADIDALNATLADLRELRRSTQAQADKARATVAAAEVELGRIATHIETIEREIDALTIEGTFEPTPEIED